jgi:CubicO group peptidase (beta-lactamase class C family)
MVRRPIVQAAACAALAFVAVLPGAVNVLRAAAAPAAPRAWPAQAAGAAVDARIARVERGLLPGIVIKGRPVSGMSLSDRLDFYRTPGVSIAVIDGGTIEWARGYGLAGAGADVRVTPRTLFQAASISKSVASAVAMRMVQQGKLSLDEDVNQRLVSWKVPDNEFTKIQKVTLRELLNHSAGLTVHGFPGYEAGAPVPSVAQVLDGAPPANTGPVRVNLPPGTVSRYSGGGFTVMQQLLTDVAGKPFPQLAAELVLRPMGMSDSTYEQPLPEDRRKMAASGHLPDGTVVPGRYHTYPEMAAAGLWTTPTDLARFAIEVYRAAKGQSNVLGEASARQMLTRLKGDYGLGLQLSGAGPTASFGHGGANAGFRCQFVMYLESGRGAAVMTNGDRGGTLAQEVLRSIAREYGWPDFAPKEKTVAQVDASVLRAYEGRYEMGPSHVVTVALEDGHLYLRDRDQRIELFPESTKRFFELVESTELEFLRDAGGTVTGLLVDGSLIARRLPPS